MLIYQENLEIFLDDISLDDNDEEYRIVFGYQNIVSSRRAIKEQNFHQFSFEILLSSTRFDVSKRLPRLSHKKNLCLVSERS